MSNPLQTKDDHWRDRPQAATPVFDPGLSPLGTDDEAGGAAAAPHEPDAAERTPLRATPSTDGPGLRLTPRFWYGAAAILAIVLVVVGVWSWHGV